MKNFRTLIFAATLAVPFAASAADLGAANGFNAFVFSSATTNGGHSDGAVAVGNNWNGSGYDVLQHNVPATMGGFDKVGMIVGGSVNYSNGGSINNSGTAHVAGDFKVQNNYNVNGGTLYYGGTKTGNVNGNKSNTNNVDASLFSTQLAYSTSQSTYLAGLSTTTSINTSDNNNWHLNNVGSGLVVVTVNASDLAANRTLDITGIASDTTLLINVTGNVASNFGLTVNSNTGKYDKILWNFATATDITIQNRALHGTILAPLATVKQYQNIDGGLIANNWENYNSAELHFGPDTFSGDLPSAPVPEPASIAALGMGALALLRRRRSSK